MHGQSNGSSSGDQSPYIWLVEICFWRVMCSSVLAMGPQMALPQRDISFNMKRSFVQCSIYCTCEVILVPDYKINYI